MPYSGQSYAVPNSFTPNTTILSSAVNANFTDIAAALSAVVKLNGDSTMTGQLKASDGSAGAPGISFGSDTDTGFYRIGANRMGLAIAGADVAGSNLYAGVRLGLPPGYNSIRVAQAADTDHDVTFAAGRARDSTDVEDIVLASALTKQIDAAWAVGTNLGGLDTGSVGNNSIYYLWVIKRSDTGVVDALFSLSATAPTMPANYDFKQRVGWVRTGGSATILGFTQLTHDPNTIFYKTTILDVTTSVQGTSAILRTLSLPPNSLAWFRMTIDHASGARVIVRPTLETDATPLTDDVPLMTGQTSGGVDVAGELQVPLDASSQLATRSDGSSTSIRIATKGATFRAPIVP